ncbi:hypothetical protein F7734_56355 [Scytonema sp. UIC 10036]|nr:hypothetical protein [Scytonema sp. UIC 10036]MUH01151.1 hypothetical protein [Scytonema sp. UIC 10036]
MQSKGGLEVLNRQTKGYRTALAPWIVVRLLSPTQQTVIGRFRSRSDADGHLAVLRRLMPDAELQVIFDMERD